MKKQLQHPKKHCNLLQSLFIPSKNIPGNNQLTESLPDELGLLTKLTALDLGAGFLKGSIPTTLGMLQELGKSKFVPIVLNLFSALSFHSNFSPLASLVTFSFHRGPVSGI